MLVHLMLSIFACGQDDTVEKNPSVSTDSTDQTDESTDTETEETESSSVEPLIFAASDVSQETIDTVTKWFEVADNFWFTEDAFGWERFNPVYVVITGLDMEATVELEQEYCAHVQEQHADSVDYSKCSANYFDPSCEDGICLFTEYVTYGGASISSFRQLDGYHLMIMAAKNPSPSEEDYGKVVLHEAFHIYQISHHTETDWQKSEERLGAKSGDHDGTVPWWMEGVAEYMAVTLYAQQPQASEGYAEQEFRNKIGYHSDSSGTPVIDDYFATGIKLYNLEYGENAWYAYSLGAWFTAYLVSIHGEQAIFDFYQDVHAYDFEENFIRQFGTPHKQYVDEFELFLQQPPEELMSIIP